MSSTTASGIRRGIRKLPRPGAWSSCGSCRAMQALPEVDRAALLMRAQDEMPYEEIAAALGISIAAAKVKVFRARMKLHDVRDAKEAP